jgi:hypothetical protein
MDLGKNLGSACVYTRSPGCLGCLHDFVCPVQDNCSEALCDMNTHTCMAEPIQPGFGYYTCAFNGPTYASTMTTGPLQTDKCQTVPKYVTIRYAKARSLVTQAQMRCSDQSGKESRALLRRAKDTLEIALLKIVVEGFGRKGLQPCVDQVSTQLDQRAARIREYLTLRDVQDACAGRPFERTSGRRHGSHRG